MPREHDGDLHGSVPDKAGTCLLIIDMINTFGFADGEALLGRALRAARAAAALKRRAKAAGIPVIYVNDNFGQWRSDFRTLLAHCLSEGCRGRTIAQILQPEGDDYFVLKPKHSGFFATPLELLLTVLHAKRLILTGVAGNSCILHTAADAYMRDYVLVVPEDCVASATLHANRAALEHMRTMLKADTTPSPVLRLDARPPAAGSPSLTRSATRPARSLSRPSSESGDHKTG
ncbi:cysteine hydrolase family protein [Candidatus Nitrospira bockiana]